MSLIILAQEKFYGRVWRGNQQRRLAGFRKTADEAVCSLKYGMIMISEEK